MLRTTKNTFHLPILERIEWLQQKRSDRGKRMYMYSHDQKHGHVAEYSLYSIVGSVKNFRALCVLLYFDLNKIRLKL
jgi:hypothetical protein